MTHAVVTQHWESPGALGRPMIGREITEFADDGSSRTRTVEVARDAIGLVTDVWRHPGALGEDVDDGIHVQTEYVQASAAPTLWLPSHVMTFSPDADTGVPVPVEELEYWYDGALGPDSAVLGDLWSEVVCLEPGIGCPQTLQWDFVRNARGVVTQTTAPSGLITVVATSALGGALPLVVDEHGDLAEPPLATTESTYDGFGRPRQAWDANGVETETLYDGLGRPLEVWVTGVGAPALRVQSHTYDHVAVPQTETTTAYTYETPSSLEQATHSHVIRDGFGREASVWSPASAAAGYTIVDTWTDPFGATVYTSEPYGAEFSEWPPAGPPEWSSDLASQARSDALGRVRKAYAPHTGWSTTTFPSEGVTRSVDSDGVVAEHVADMLGQVTQVWQGRDTDPALTQTAAYAWDGRGRVLRFTDADGNAYAYDFDGAGRLLGVDRAGPSEPWADWYDYDYIGPFPRQRYEGGAADPSTTWTFDVRGRPLEEVVTRLDAPFDEVYTWTWDTLWNGSLTESADPWGAVSYEYDTGTTFGQGGLTVTERSWHTHASVRWLLTKSSHGLRRQPAERAAQPGSSCSPQ